MVLKSIIGYLRVSTKKQGDSGLGLEAQQAAIEAYARATGVTIIRCYVEIETGKIADRPELAKALAHAKLSKSVLCVAKLDRLARNMAFTSAVMDSGAEFVACDNPHANRLTLHILAAVAENEARAISDRTKAALNAAKARGKLLGSARPGHWEGHEEARLHGAKLGSAVSANVRGRLAKDAYSHLLPEMQRQRQENKSLQAITNWLNEQGHATRRGRPWNPVQVLRVLTRVQAG
jgi:DNA invertase Pin-like site-specific DNA recombinase